LFVVFPISTSFKKLYFFITIALDACFRVRQMECPGYPECLEIELHFAALGVG